MSSSFILLCNHELLTIHNFQSELVAITSLQPTQVPTVEKRKARAWTEDERESIGRRGERRGEIEGRTTEGE